jgi:hypothetical protein
MDEWTIEKRVATEREDDLGFRTTARARATAWMREGLLAVEDSRASVCVSSCVCVCVCCVGPLGAGA